MSFLNAEWRKLAIANYEVDPKVLEPYLPFGTDLDLWNGRCYVSLVGFMFLDTRLLGIPIPFHRNFEEVNLRFYVKRFEGTEGKRGVVFVKEIVPKLALTWVANTVYKEHYQTLKMDHNWTEEEQFRMVEYGWEIAGKKNSFSIKANLDSTSMEVGSETEFITEHYWGYTKIDEQTTFEYEVRHPRWEAYEVIDFNVDVNFDQVYGNNFEFLNHLKPTSVMLAEGSEISVENKRKLR